MLLSKVLAATVRLHGASFESVKWVGPLFPAEQLTKILFLIASSLEDRCSNCTNICSGSPMLSFGVLLLMGVGTVWRKALANLSPSWTWAGVVRCSPSGSRGSPLPSMHVTLLEAQSAVVQTNFLVGSVEQKGSSPELTGPWNGNVKRRWSSRC